MHYPRSLIIFSVIGAVLLYASDGYTASLNTSVSITDPEMACARK
jgi:hypothetical protein